MKRNLIISAILIFLTGLYGCKSIRVGGAGKVGGVTGSGSVTVPIPER